MIVFNGATGGLGRYMSAALENAGMPFFVLRSRLKDTVGLAHELDSQVREIQKSNELLLIQMAALVPVLYCEEHPEEAFMTNVTDTLATVSTVTEWGRLNKILTRILYVSTGHVYDRAAPGIKVTEDAPVRPQSVYAKTKLAAERDILSLSRRSEVKCLIARVFGLLSRYQSSPYVLPSLVRRVRDSNYSGIPGLKNVRDYLDARDVCAHLMRLCDIPWLFPGDPIVNVCSGEPVSIEQLLMTIVDVMSVDLEAVRLKLSEGVGRASDLPWIVGDPSRLTMLTKQPARMISLVQTIQDVLK